MSKFYEVHWSFSINVTKEHAKSMTLNFYDFFNHLQFLCGCHCCAHENELFYVCLFIDMHWSLLKLDFYISVVYSIILRVLMSTFVKYSELTRVHS